MRDAFCGRCVVTAAHAQVTEAETAQLRALVESGRSAQAYERFCKSEREFPQRDLWCGVALVDIGRAGEAAIALERYVLTNPDDARGRLELARAYYHAGDDVRARTEFEAVQAMNPPADVLVGINRYLDALFQRESLYRRRTLLYVEAGIGYDSNVNGGVAQADISLPVLGRVTVLDTGIEKSDSFGFAAIGGQINQPFAPGWSAFGSFDAQGTFYQSENDFNLAALSANAGASYERGTISLRFRRRTVICESAVTVIAAARAAGSNGAMRCRRYRALRSSRSTRGFRIRMRTMCAIRISPLSRSTTAERGSSTGSPRSTSAFSTVTNTAARIGPTWCDRSPAPTSNSPFRLRRAGH